MGMYRWMGSHIFWFFGLDSKNVLECLYGRWKVKCSSVHVKIGSIHKYRKWLSWDGENYIFAQQWSRYHPF